jgi:hypothetical protein
MRRTACLIALLPVLAGCGGGDSGDSGPKGTPDPEAKKAAQEYIDAYAAGSPPRICAALAGSVRKQLADDKGTCEKTIAANIKGQNFEKLTVKEALADGGTAHAIFEGIPRQITLVRDPSAWKVSDGGT